MNPLVNMSYSDQLKHDLFQHQGIMQILHALYAIDTQAYLAAGVVRNLIWSQRHQQQIQLIAPLGLDDLFELNVRWNPRLVSQATFLQRVQQKKFLQRWPKLKLLMTPKA
ncbi:nucleotidyltransferase family protein [Acinetobacter sp. YH1901130]|uniref:nucleotidyltransferase family protein n=2 Tax=unclassified Acinetobacter TaxID=196816 RepID=UPI0035A18533